MAWNNVWIYQRMFIVVTGIIGLSVVKPLKCV